ncbi:hypothetical protein [Actinophytocola oryzae]|uniref:Uncharacterized protein n=1 Tax=Actinophytocola oryzae TaxID=502181 RepID=A0A4R7VYX4_9PSEU|nr:hypothetical protein [Actinophytocola oryzae]TDV54975.1 hypothetical protein CLV71_103216 [Actinophytocola oryzae]
MVDVTIDLPAGDGPAVVKLQSPQWELNIRAPREELARLREIDGADWDSRRSLAVGTCAGAGVFWALGEDDQVAILVGPDDESWDAAVLVPLRTVHEIAARALGLADSGLTDAEG